MGSTPKQGFSSRWQMIVTPHMVAVVQSESGKQPFTSTYPAGHEGYAPQLPTSSLCWHQIVAPHAKRE